MLRSVPKPVPMLQTQTDTVRVFDCLMTWNHSVSSVSPNVFSHPKNC